MHNNLKTAHSEDIEQAKPNQPEGRISDSQFYYSLAKYSPLCFNNKGMAIFLYPKQISSVVFVVVFSTPALLLYLSFLTFHHFQKEHGSQAQIILLSGTIICLMCANFSFIMAYCLNPGIRNLSQITEQEYEQFGKYFCYYCENYRTEKMKHCLWCKVCVEDIDHHCSVFNKCIAGGLQIYMFYCFIFLVFLTLILLMVTSIIQFLDLN